MFDKQKTIHCAIILNLVVISMGGYDVSEKKATVLARIGLALTCTFVVEAFIKISVLGMKGYFRSRCVHGCPPHFMC